MHPFLRILGIVVVFTVATVGWFVLAGVTESRTNTSRYSLSSQVVSLWGRAQVQAAPTLVLYWQEEVVESKDTVDAHGNVVGRRVERHFESRTQNVDPASTRINVDMHQDERRKGLMWFPLYDVGFDGTWTYTHAQSLARDLQISFPFPDSDAMYDDFHFVVNGTELGAEARPVGGVASTTIHVEPGQSVSFAVKYKSRGADTWSYQPTAGVGQVEDFALAMTTDFKKVDFVVPGRSPSAKQETADGWKLDWEYTRAVAGFGMGMVMPTRVQPGQLATSLAFSAPLSLGLYFLWIYVLGILKGKEAHPINYFFLSGAFFAFNLLFAYTADHLDVEYAFALSAGVSLGLAVSYLRLVLGARFAFLEAGIAQLLYQVGFATAHFFDGFTGLTVTVLGILTLFALMQMTGRMDWSSVLGGKGRGAAKPAPAPIPA